MLNKTRAAIPWETWRQAREKYFNWPCDLKKIITRIVLLHKNISPVHVVCSTRRFLNIFNDKNSNMCVLFLIIRSVRCFYRVQRSMGMSIKFSTTRRINERRLVVCCLNKSSNVILMSSQKCVLISLYQAALTTFYLREIWCHYFIDNSYYFFSIMIDS